MTRNGKIGRLPKAVREQVNRRLEKGEKGRTLVAWLNAGKSGSGKAVAEGQE